MTTNGNNTRESTLNGRTALVTGAAKGIGRAIAVHLGSRGAAVAINYRASKAEAESVAGELEDMGVDWLLVPGDVSDRAEAGRVVQTVLDEWKHLDILVNNAGICREKVARSGQDAAWSDVINVNLNGTFYCTSAALPSMIQQRFGRIINISSYVGQAGNFSQANYAAHKGGIIAFTRALAIEMARYNITANAIAPGFTSTDAIEEVPANILEQIRSKIPLGRFGTPDEVAKAALFLAADGDYVTGQQLNVNGGLYT